MDCQVWSSEPDTSKDTATWAGECADGKATGPGRLEWFVDKKLWGHYEGQMAEGKLDGRLGAEGGVKRLGRLPTNTMY